MIFSRTNSRKYRYLVYMIFLLKLKCNCYILFLGGFNGIFISKNKSFKAPRLFVCFIRFVILENLNPRVFCRRYLNYVPNPTGIFMNSKKQLYKHDRLFQLMADNVLDGVAIIENQKVIYVNNRLCEITGYPMKNCLNWTALRSLRRKCAKE